MSIIKIPYELKKVNDIFISHGFKAYLVGGAVRDAILGKAVHDFDLATNARPEEVMKIFHKVVPTGIAHGTVTIHIFGMELETTTFRTEADYSDGRHPDKVEYAGKIEEDLSRRDFTMNAIAFDLTDECLVDPFNGQEDIKNKIIRTVGSPYKRFNEDGLRPVRAVRFAGQLGFKIEEETFKALSNERILKKVQGISVERFRDEFNKILLSKKPSYSLKLLEESGMLNLFIGEFSAARNCIQSDARGFHEFDVADHLLYSTDGAKVFRENKSIDKDTLLVLRLSAFFHDIGKPAAKKIQTVTDSKTGVSVEEIHFHGHENKGEEMTRQILIRLKYPNAIIERVCHLVKEHMFYYESNWSDAAVRRFIVRTGLENIDDLFALRLADIYGKHNKEVEKLSPARLNLLEFEERIKKVIEESTAFSIKDLRVKGTDLIACGIPAGKTLGLILKELFETVLDSPSMNEKQKLLDLAKNLYQEKYSL